MSEQAEKFLAQWEFEHIADSDIVARSDRVPGSEVRRPVDWKKASHFRPHMGIQRLMGPG